MNRCKNCDQDTWGSNNMSFCSDDCTSEYVEKIELQNIRLTALLEGEYVFEGNDG